MRLPARRPAAAALALGASCYVALTARLPLGVSDYHNDAGPAIAALAHGHVGRFLSLHPLMGPFSLMLRAPLAALAYATGGGELEAYRLGLIPCLLAVAALTAWLVARMTVGARSRAARAMLVGVVVVSPFTGQALSFGHPEELLAGALAVGALVLAADGGRPLVAGALLGLALATKQWAILAAVPVLAAAPRGRWRLGAVAVAVPAALMLPGLIAGLGGSVQSLRGLSNAHGWVSPPNLWWPLSHVEVQRAVDSFGSSQVVRHVLPAWANPIAHPLVVLVALVLGLCVLWRPRRPSPDQALALLGLVFLVRCALDPWNNSYYAVPLVLALIARDAVRPAGLPASCALAVALLWLVLVRLPALAGTDIVFAAYLTLAGALAAWLGPAALAPGWAATMRRRLSRPVRPRLGRAPART